MAKSLRKNSLFNILYNTASVLFPFITSIYTSRVLQSDGIGKVAYGQNLASYFVIFAVLGLPTYGVREIAKIEKNQDDINKVFTELIIINALFTTIATFFYVLLILCVPKFKSDFKLFFSCGLQIVLNYLNIDWFYQGKEEYIYISIRSIIVKTVSFFMVLLIVKRHDDYILYALISSLALSANYIFNIIHARKYVKITLAGLNFKRHYKSLIILAVSYFLSAAYSKIDITMLGSMSTESATGIYNNAHKIIDMAIVVCSSISSVFLPRLSYYYKYNRSQFLALIEMGIRILSFISFPVTIEIFIVAPQIMRILYGESFAAGALTIRIFSLLILVKSFGNLLCYQLVIATENEKKRLLPFLFAAIFNIIFNAILIPRMAQNGAAIASVVSELIVNVLQFIAIHKLLSIKLSAKPIIEAVTTSVVMGIAGLLISRLFDCYLLQLGSSAILGVAIYFLLNYIIRNETLINILNIAKRSIRRLNI